MSKKKRASTAQRRNQRKQQKRKKLKKIKKRMAVQEFANDNFTKRNSAIPKGFRPISMANAMSQYMSPLFERVGSDSGDFDKISLIGTQLWNYPVFSQMDGIDKIPFKQKKLVKLIKKALKIDKNEAAELINEMLKRKSYLFPPEIQPPNPMLLFIRNMEHVEFQPFDYEELTRMEKPTTLEEADRRAADLLSASNEFSEKNELEYEEEPEYEEIESLYFKMKEPLFLAYSHWLERKGIEKYREIFSSRIGVFLDFLYLNLEGSLLSVSQDNLLDFLGEFVLFKVSIEPAEHSYWIPALKYLFFYLGEIGYPRISNKILRYLDYYEPRYNGILRDYFRVAE